MQDFYLIRHGETDWNIKLGRLQGHTDIPLNEKGELQAQALAPLIRDLGVTKAISSDLSRALKTAQSLMGPNALIDTNSDLREVNLGMGEGMTWDEVTAQLGAEFREKWSVNKGADLNMRFPNGESRLEVIQRVEKCLRFYLNQFPNEKIAFVTHGYVIRSMVYHFSAIQGPFFVPNCAIVPFRFQNQKIIYSGPETTDLLMQPRLQEL